MSSKAFFEPKAGTTAKQVTVDIELFTGSTITTLLSRQAVL